MAEIVDTVTSTAFNEDKEVIEAIQETYDRDFKGMAGPEYSVAADHAAIAARRIVANLVQAEQGHEAANLSFAEN